MDGWISSQNPRNPNVSRAHFFCHISTIRIWFFSNPQLLSCSHIRFCFTKSLAQILSRDSGFTILWPNPEPTIGLHPNPNPDSNPNLNPNPSRRVRNFRITGWSRHQINFLPITSQGSIFILRYVG